MTYGSWLTTKYYGDVHVVPLLDSRIHIWPMCWCRPKRENCVTEYGPAQAILYSHNAIDGRT